MPYRKLLIAGAIALCAIVAVGVLYRMAHRKLFDSFNNPAFTDKYYVRGVDVSHHNSYIDWMRLREENITFVYLKSTEGTSHKDRDYQRNHKLAREAGLKVGTYHFYTFGLDGNMQAEHFIRNSLVFSQDIVPAIDVEHSPTNRAPENKEEFQQLITELKILEEKLFEYYGKHPIIYTNKDGYRLYIEKYFPDNPLWICDLHNEPDVASDRWIIWQFSHTGNISGVAGDIDLNYYRYSFTDFRNLLMP